MRLLKLNLVNVFNKTNYKTSDFWNCILYIRCSMKDFAQITWNWDSTKILEFCILYFCNFFLNLFNSSSNFVSSSLKISWELSNSLLFCICRVLGLCLGWLPLCVNSSLRVSRSMQAAQLCIFLSQQTLFFPAKWGQMLSGPGPCSIAGEGSGNWGRAEFVWRM